MRKILISVLIVLLVVLAGLMIFKGLIIGDFQILSVEQIIEEDEKLTKEISQTELLMYNTFKSKNDELSKSVTSLLNAKEEYLDLASVSTETQLSKAGQDETYTVEFLWTKLGGYSTAEGVGLKYDIASGTTGQSNIKNINFTVTGTYIQIINFLSAIEGDSDLYFIIENMNLVPSGSNLQATFVVKNISIKQENSTVTSSSGSITEGTSGLTSGTSSEALNSIVNSNGAQ